MPTLRDPRSTTRSICKQLRSGTPTVPVVTINNPGPADDDLFGWPLVVEDRNVQGPLSIATPGTVAGWALALERFGTLPWSEVIVPAIELARRGMKVDWYATLRIANDARGLSQNPAASAFFLPDGLPPVSTDPDNLVTLRSDAQVATLERLRVAGIKSPADLARLSEAELRMLLISPGGEPAPDYNAWLVRAAEIATNETDAKP